MKIRLLATMPTQFFGVALAMKVMLRRMGKHSIALERFSARIG
ncbi:hypothetical protein [uncultured Sphingomonas sp.]